MCRGGSKMTLITLLTTRSLDWTWTAPALPCSSSVCSTPLWGGSRRSSGPMSFNSSSCLSPLEGIHTLHKIFLISNLTSTDGLPSSASSSSQPNMLVDQVPSWKGTQGWGFANLTITNLILAITVLLITITICCPEKEHMGEYLQTRP